MSRESVAGRGRTLLAVGVCLAVAGLSLLLPYNLSGDAYGWLVYGREMHTLALDSAAIGAWKPLPVLFTSVISLTGDAAPALWLVMVRAGWLLALVLAFRVGQRLAGPVAGAIGALSLLFIPNARAEWMNYFAQGNSEPLIAAALLGAIERHMAGHRLQALALGTLATLGRPEAWPLLIAYAWLLWRSQTQHRAVIIGLTASVPILWIGPDLFTGNLTASAERTRQAKRPGSHATAPPAWSVLGAVRSILGAVRTAALLVIAPVGLGALVAVGSSLRRGWRAGDDADRVIVATGLGAITWILTVAITGLFDVPTWTRFMYAPAAVLGVLGGVGIVRLLRAIPDPRARLALALALAAVGIAFALPRARQLPPQLIGRADTPARRSLIRLLERTDARGRAERCGGTITVLGAIPNRAAEIAWRLRLPLHSVRTVPKRTTVTVRQGIVIARARPKRFAAQPPSPGSPPTPRIQGTLVATEGKWSLSQVNCAPPGSTRS